MMKTTMMTTMEMKINHIPVAVVITAAGSSTRMGGQKKEYRSLGSPSATVLSVATEAFVSALAPQVFSDGRGKIQQTKEDSPLPFHLTHVVITIPPHSGTAGEQAAKKALFSSPNLKSLWENPFQKSISTPQLVFVEGGESRQASVYKALQALTNPTEQVDSQGEPEIVLIHDGARPFVTEEIILQVVAATQEQGAAACGIPPVDTQKEVNSQGFIVRHLQRDSLVAIQTPQGFRLKPLLQAHQRAAADNFETTDDTAIWGKYVGPVKITLGSVDNKKITFPGDLPHDTAHSKEAAMNLRTGLGYDLHRLEEGRTLILGGVVIPFHKGESGHSDGDVLLHAITDALLGAVARSDIGELFPPSDVQWKGADSRQLLQAAWSLVTEAGWKLVNLDCVVAIQEPKILPHREAIRKSIAAILQVDVDQVFIKAKTGEKLGPVGNSEAVEVWATCLLTK